MAVSRQMEFLVGYFDRNGTPPAIPVPSGARLWANGGALSLAWRRPLGGCDGYVVLAGNTPAALAEVARLAAATTCWPVPAGLGPWLAVACLRGAMRGEPGALVWVANDTVQPEIVAAESADDLIAPQPATDAALVCQCCAPPRCLVPGDGTLVCPHTGELYAALATGGLARAVALPFGLCRCCEAKQPLIRCGDKVVCLAQPDQTYVRQGNIYVPGSPNAEPVALTDGEAIDAALRANSALLGRHGMFVRERS